MARARKHPYRDLRRNEHTQATIHCGFTTTHSPLIVAIMAWTTPIGAIAGAVIGRLRRKAPLAAAAPDQRPDSTSTFWPRVTGVDGTFVALNAVHHAFEHENVKLVVSPPRPPDARCLLILLAVVSYACMRCDRHAAARDARRTRPRRSATAAVLIRGLLAPVPVAVG